MYEHKVRLLVDAICQRCWLSPFLFNVCSQQTLLIIQSMCVLIGCYIVGLYLIVFRRAADYCKHMSVGVGNQAICQGSFIPPPPHTHTYCVLYRPHAYTRASIGLLTYNEIGSLRLWLLGCCRLYVDLHPMSLLAIFHRRRQALVMVMQVMQPLLVRKQQVHTGACNELGGELRCLPGGVLSQKKYGGERLRIKSRTPN